MIILYVKEFEDDRYCLINDRGVIVTGYRTAQQAKRAIRLNVHDDRGLSKSAVPLLSKMFPPIF